ncbi:ATP-binding protein [Micromonospora fluostatini]|uniref:ATP-binding protein n=1 Tax=Micromonospora fluostatini TaxID=1629071 RepID=A0ABY2DF65_9ACTN|nr:ATP-binding protein [Micromonospora fluostatini]
MSSSRPRLAGLLRTTRDQAFVGRAADLALFRSALAGVPGTPSVFFLHGPGGVGKSTLLRRFADESRDAGRLVVELDGRLVDPAPQAFEIEAAPAMLNDRVVLLVDAFERCQGLEVWLRERYLPQLPDGTLVVLAGREPPDPAWTADLAWREALRVVPVRDLTPAEAGLMLDAQGVPPGTRPAILDFAGGHPLALTLAAAVVTTGPSAPAGRDTPDPWAPTPDVVSSLMGRLIGEVPSAAHLRALEVAAHTLVTTEALLRVVLAVDDAGPLFRWLRGLPFVEPGPAGLFLHDLVKEVVDTDLRWRDPHRYDDGHARIGGYLLDQVRAAPEPRVLSAMRELTYLKRFGAMGPYFRGISHEGGVYEDVLRPGDHRPIRRMTVDCEGEESAAVVEHWLAAQPDSFRVYRRSASGELVAFLAWLRLTVPDEGAPVDPVAATVWAHLRRSGLPRPGEEVLLARYIVHPEAYHSISPVSYLMQLRMCADWIRSGRLAWSFIIASNPDFWHDLMVHIGHRPVPERPVLDGQAYTLFGCDWRVTPLSVWFDRTQPGRILDPEPLPADAAGAVVLPTREEHDGAVRAALRDWHHDEALATSPLLRTRPFVDRAGGDAPVDALRDALTTAVDALRADPREIHLHRVVATTYFHRVPTQAAAAERLGLPFSTYRRHLSRGVQRICDRLWRLEAGGGD